MRRSAVIVLTILFQLIGRVGSCAEKTTANPSSPTLRVAAVQMRSSRDLPANVAKIDEQLAKCAHDGVRVAVFPECALTGYFDNAFIQGISAEHLHEAEQHLTEACRRYNIYAIVGTPYRDGNRLLNSSLVIAPTGKVVARYHKIQLAETWPTAGTQLVVFKIDDVPATIIICHDERYPELVRLPVLAGAEIVFYLSHESGVTNEAKIGPYRAQIQARAVENNVFVVQANAPANKDTTGSHGQSRIIAPDGNLIREASVFSEDVVIATLDLKQASRQNALKSIERGPLADWWRAGLTKVQVVGKDGAVAPFAAK